MRPHGWMLTSSQSPVGSHEWLPIVTTCGLLAAGSVGAFAGVAWAALAFSGAILMAGVADRRAAPLLALVILPALTAFHELEAARIEGSALDFRLLLTGGTAVALAIRVILDRAWPDRVGWLLVGFVILLAALAPASDAGPLRALPTITRAAIFALSYLLARRVLGTEVGLRLATVAVILGGIAPMLSGMLELVAGSAVPRNDALRVAGLYGDSPVGLALMMQIVAVAAVGFGHMPRLGRHATLASAIVAVGACIVLASTATRLAFIALVAGIGAAEVLRRSERRAAGAIAPMVLVLVLGFVIQPDLLTRIISTGAGPVPTPISTPGTPSSSPVAVASPEPTPSASAEPGPIAVPPPSDTSFRFRLFVWTTMARAWTEAPLLGHGPGSFAAVFEERTGLERIAPHNDYLGVLVESGVVGLALFLVIQISVSVTLLRARFGGVMPGLIASVLVIFVATNVLNAINNPLYYLDLQVVVWSLVGAAIGARQGRGAAQVAGAAMAR